MEFSEGGCEVTLAVAMAGQAVQVTEPRVCRMIQFLLAREA
jgi:hypothetical protein